MKSTHGQELRQHLETATELLSQLGVALDSRPLSLESVASICRCVHNASAWLDGFVRELRDQGGGEGEQLAGAEALQELYVQLAAICDRELRRLQTNEPS